VSGEEEFRADYRESMKPTMRDAVVRFPEV
jgi:hypothetical protein